MKLLKIEGQSVVYPYSEATLRAAYPNTSFPRDLSDFDLSGWGVYRVEPITCPDPVDRTYYVEGPPELAEGVWRQTWEAREIPIEEWRAGLTCTPVQFRLAALQIGVLDQIEALVAGDAELRIRLEYGLRVERAHPAFDVLAPALDKSPEDIDALFELARSID